MNTPSAALQLWHAKVGEPSLQAEQAVIPLLSASETQHLAAIKSGSKRREFLLSRALMRHALTFYFNEEQSSWTFIYSAHSAPNITNLPESYCVSLTHRKGYILFIISPYPVGVDIELIKPKNNLVELAEMFMTPNEHAKLIGLRQPQQLDYYYQVWTAKESYYKAHSQAEQAAIQFSDIDIVDVIECADRWQLLQKKERDLMCSIVIASSTKNEVDCQHHWLLDEQ